MRIQQSPPLPWNELFHRLDARTTCIFSSYAYIHTAFFLKGENLKACRHKLHQQKKSTKNFRRPFLYLYSCCLTRMSSPIHRDHQNFGAALAATDSCRVLNPYVPEPRFPRAPNRNDAHPFLPPPRPKRAALPPVGGIYLPSPAATKPPTKSPLPLYTHALQNPTRSAAKQRQSKAKPTMSLAVPHLSQPQEQKAFQAFATGGTAKTPHGSRKYLPSVRHRQNKASSITEYKGDLSTSPRARACSQR